MKVKVIKPYKDLQLNRTVLLNEVLSVTEERGNHLIGKGLVEPTQVKKTETTKKKTSKKNEK